MSSHASFQVSGSASVPGELQRRLAFGEKPVMAFQSSFLLRRCSCGLPKAGDGAGDGTDSTLRFMNVSIRCDSSLSSRNKSQLCNAC